MPLHYELDTYLCRPDAGLSTAPSFSVNGPVLPEIEHFEYDSVERPGVTTSSTRWSDYKTHNALGDGRATTRRIMHLGPIVHLLQ